MRIGLILKHSATFSRDHSRVFYNFINILDHVIEYKKSRTPIGELAGNERYIFSTKFCP